MASWEEPQIGEDPEEEVAPPFDARELLVAGAARSWKLILVTGFLGACAGVVMSLYKVNTYTSEASLLLRIGAREELTAEDFFGQGSGGGTPGTTLRDELQLLNDMAIYTQVARLLGAAEILDPGDPSALDGPDTPWYVVKMHEIQKDLLAMTSDDREKTGTAPHAGLQLAAEVLKRNTRLWTDEGSNVINVAYTATTPEKAQQIVFALIDAFKERHRQQFSIVPYYESNLAQVMQARERSSAAQESYDRHRAACGFYDVEAQWEELSRELETLRTELEAARLRRDTLKSARDQLSARLGDLGVTTEYDALLRRKRELESERGQALAQSKFRPEQRRKLRELENELLNVDGELKKLEANLGADGRASASQSISVGTEADNLRRRLAYSDPELTNLNQRIAHMEERMGRLESSATRLRECSGLHQKMLGDIETEKALLEQVSARFSTVEALHNVEKQGDINLRVLHEPTYPFEKSGPRRSRLAIGGLIGGLGMGLMFAMLRQALDKRLRYPGSTQRALGVPVLAVVPARRIPRPKRGSLDQQGAA